MVAAGEGLQRNQSRVILEQDGHIVSGFDLGLVGAANDAFPTKAGAVEPVGELDPAERAAAVLQLRKGGGAAARARP